MGRKVSTRGKAYYKARYLDILRRVRKLHRALAEDEGSSYKELQKIFVDYLLKNRLKETHEQ